MSDRGSTVFSAFDELREFFTLREGERAASALGEAHPAAARALRLGAQRVRAAQALAQSGHRAEAERLLALALASLSSARDEWPALEPMLRALPSLTESEEPALDDELSTERVAALDAALDESSRVLARAESASIDKRARRATRVRRNGAVGLVLTVAAVVSWQQSRIVKLTPRASSTFGAQYIHTNATDGFVATNWLLPDGTPGWLEVSFDRRRVSTLEMTNVQNLSHYGAAETTVEFYSGARLVRSMDVSMRATVNTANVTRVAIPVREPLDRIRINIRTFHDLGGGLSEVKVR